MGIESSHEVQHHRGIRISPDVEAQTPKNTKISPVREEVIMRGLALWHLLRHDAAVRHPGRGGWRQEEVPTDRAQPTRGSSRHDKEGRSKDRGTEE